MPNRLIPLCLIACAALAFACANEAASPAAPSATVAPAGATDTSPQKTPFDGERAFAHVRTQVNFGPRPAGSAALEKTREFLLQELRSYPGLKVSVDEFKPVTPRGRIVMKNLIAELPGQTPATIIIGSHYDTKEFKRFTFVGANDGGSSTGALLEIARVLAAAGPRKYTYQFVFFDGEEAFCEEWGECLDGKDHTYGSQYMADRLKAEKRTSQVKAMILLDMVGDKDLTIPREESSSQWLVEAIWGTASEIGYGKEFPSRSFMIGDDDHMPFLRNGIPAVDVIDFEYGHGNGDHSYWHTAEDTLDKVSARSLKIVGDVIILCLPKVEAQIR